MSTTLDIQPISGTLGAEVRGVSLADLDEASHAVVHQALLDHLVLFFPDQHLTPDQHVGFAERFGPPEIHPFIPKLDEDHPEIVVLEAKEGYVADVWHTDVTFRESPPLCSVLNALVMPDRGGDTMWSNQYAAYEALSDPIKEMIGGLTAINSAAVFGQPDVTAEQPVVRVHPETAKPSLFVNRQFTRRIVQLSREESDALLTMLFAHGSDTRFSCRYSWSPGDIGIWDNRCTQHYAVNDFVGDRVISRVTILGDDPKPAFDVSRHQPYQYASISASSHGFDRD